MSQFDLLLRGGTIIDGTGQDRYVADIAIKDGVIAHIGTVAPERAAQVIDLHQQIVAPGVIDLHTHYEAQLHWDPYLTPSGWHGSTTAVCGNCGHGLAPCKPEMQERYMRMLENTEQIPYESMRTGLSWDWETFPEFLDHLRSLPKGVNVGTFLPVNPLLSYVIGPDEAKRRPATVAERARMRALLHEAMDAGACGFGFSYLGAKGNSHVDADGTAMPCDVMAEEEAYNLCEVLRERGEGVIQVLCELPGGIVRRDLAEELARRSTRPIIHTATLAVNGSPEAHRGTLRWLDDAASRGLSIYSQAITSRQWQEFTVLDYTAWDCIAEFRQLSYAKTIPEKLQLIQDPAYRAQVRTNYNPDELVGQAGILLEQLILNDACGSAEFKRFETWRIKDIAAELKRPLTDTFFDILVASGMHAQLCDDGARGANAQYAAEICRNPRTLPGLSDGGAHNKFFSGGHWSTDMIIWLARETQEMTLEEIHQLLSGRASEVFGLKKRGLLKPGYAADIIAYDFNALTYVRNRYEIVNDMPNGDWRRVTKVDGMRCVIVNGTPTFVDGVCTGNMPGKVISNAQPRAVVTAAMSAAG
jgi:N-acyl-D-amino-acid deacylase